VAHAHLRYLNPFPANTGDVLRAYRRVLVPEVNLGQLWMLIRSRYLIDAIAYNRVRGKPFRIAELEAEAERVLAGGGHVEQQVAAVRPAARTVPASAAATGDGG
jgi:2-oxoglutarate ferredoxin oxidoreductase subunit alpha